MVHEICRDDSQPWKPPRTLNCKAKYTISHAGIGKRRSDARAPKMLSASSRELPLTS